MLERNNAADAAILHHQTQLKESQLLAECSFPNWYKKFAKISIKSVCLKIPQDIVKYLLDEIIILPKECMTAGDIDEQHRIHVGFEDEDTEAAELPEFPLFSKQIQTKIAELGGSAYVKTNWHSPKDAFWITAGQTMRCQDITDVYQLLKASSICKEDLVCFKDRVNDDDESEEQHDDTDSWLVLKKWKEIHPGTEFRCFVRNNSLIAISPRDWPQYHEHILTQKRDIINDIMSMFKEQIKQKFPLANYIFDVVRDSKDKVYLLDFSPFGRKWSDALAFDWDELEDDDFEAEIIQTINAMDDNNEEDEANNDDDDEDDGPELRYLSSDCGIQPNKRNNYGIPQDIIDMFKASGPSSSPADGPAATTNTLDDFLANRIEHEINNENQRSD